MRIPSTSRHLLAAIAALALTAAPTHAQATGASQPAFKGIWEPVNFKQDIKFTDVYFTSPTTGWVTGEHGTLLKTTDGGDTWTAVLGGEAGSPDEQIHALRFLDATHGWAVQGRSKLLRTADGENWEEIGKLGTNFGFWNDYTFTSDKVGVQIVSQNDELERTQDGGKTWTRIVNNCGIDAEVQGLMRKLGCHLKNVVFVTATNGYAIGATTPGTHMVLFHTVDGGLTWTPQLVPDVASQNESFFWQGLAFVDENRGFAILPSGHKFLGTSAGGATWHGVIGSVGGPLRVADPEVGWSIVDKRLTYTVTGGGRWSSVDIPVPAAVNAFALPHRDRGYVVGDHGMIYRYRVVPAAYTAPRMITSVAMPGVDSALAADAGQVLAQVAVLQAAVSKASNKPLGPDSSFVNTCCAAEAQKLQTMVGQVATETPKFTGRYRSLNLIIPGLQMVADLLGGSQGLQASLSALKQGRDPAAISAALQQLSTQADGIVTRVKTFQTSNK